jgi:O-acetyl-ADP-ribose deacetylase
MQIIYKNTKLSVVQADITTLYVDCIINSANSQLLGGAGVDRAIHNAAGPELDEVCKKLYEKHGELLTTNGVITAGFNLPVKAIMHVLSPVWLGGGRLETYKLILTYANILKLANKYKFIKTIAIPSLSTGIFKFPIEIAVKFAIGTIKTCLDCNKYRFNEVIFCTYSKYDFYLYKQELKTGELL